MFAPAIKKITEAWVQYCEYQHPFDKKIQYEMKMSNEKEGKYRNEFIVFCHAYHMGYVDGGKETN